MPDWRRPFRPADRAAEVVWYYIKAYFPRPAGRKHDLPGELIVSLTSYPPRFRTLHLTLRTLLSQSTRPDRVILWIAHNDLAQLPHKVRAMERRGLEIRGCDDLRSFQKIVPAILQFPDAWIATADDDLYYDRHWLRDLVRVAESGRVPPLIIAYRAFRFQTDGQALVPVKAWFGSVWDADSLVPSHNLFPTSGAGTLYPPYSLHADVTKWDLFERLSPNCDDSWLTWMAYRAGTQVRRSILPHRSLHVWKGTHADSLWLENGRLSDGLHGIDRSISAMTNYFGPIND